MSRNRKKFINPRYFLNETMEGGDTMALPRERLALIEKDLHAARDLLEDNPEANELVTNALHALQNEMAKADDVYRAEGDPSVAGQGGH